MDRPHDVKGTLTFEENVFRSIAERILDAADGVRLAQSARGGLIQRIRHPFTGRVQVSAEQDRVDYVIPVVVRASGDVRAVCQGVQRDVERETHYMTGISHVSVNMSIRGIE